ncbi:hypothetical protein BV25DRAFT_1915747 [Artomyces pyxidatus]|uniref:Uncharacterized protein n=1 Tax=Artomyces pyxidatus TaxID=48021 RepID=A0ACB8T2P6_9AGAM|nr:hypothetical protein BV25DRAFT_1915747 [Artomyces pyxidatus]
MSGTSSTLWIVVKTLYLRITLNRITLSFFLFAFIHCFTQGILQSLLFSTDTNWSQFTDPIVQNAQINSSEFIQYTGKHGSYSLGLCKDHVPEAGVRNSCVPFFTAGDENVTIPAGFRKRATAIEYALIADSNTPITWLMSGGSPSADITVKSAPPNVVVSQASNASNFVVLSQECTRSLLYPQAKLNQSEREEISLIASQFWLFGLSVFAYLRITLNRITLSFFLFAFIHCFTQGILQSLLFSTDTNWSQFTDPIVQNAQINSSEFIQYTGKHGSYSLGLCKDHVPEAGVRNSCVPFFTAGDENVTIPAGFRKRATAIEYALIADSNTPITWLMSGGSPSADITVKSAPPNVVVSQASNASNFVVLSQECTRSLLYPQAKLNQSEREEISLIASQFWLFGLSVFAIVFESIPHLLALVIARFLATGWSAYDVWKTNNIGQRLQHLIGNPDTPCHLDIYRPYVETRISYQIVDLVLNCTALLLSIFLSWRLIRVYQTHTFNRAGPPGGIIKIYRTPLVQYFLAVLVSLQLSVFFLLVAMGLWVDQLLNSTIEHLSSHTAVYDAAFISTTVLLIPWIAMGWFAVRREKKYLMVAFLCTGFVFVAEWSIMFYSEVYRFTFVDWPFFGAMTIASFVVIISSAVFGIVCWLRFDMGLKQYLRVEEELARLDFEPELFPHETEKKWEKEDEERASVYLASMPHLLSEGGAVGPTPLHYR